MSEDSHMPKNISTENTQFTLSMVTWGRNCNWTSHHNLTTKKYWLDPLFGNSHFGNNMMFAIFTKCPIVMVFFFLYLLLVCSSLLCVGFVLNVFFSTHSLDFILFYGDVAQNIKNITIVPTTLRHNVYARHFP